MRRELTISLGAPITWWIAATVALVVGHSFVLAVDLFGAASRSAEGVGTMTRGLEPLLGIVTPTFGAATFCVTLLGPILAARGVAIDRERRTLHAVLLRAGSPGRVVLAKWVVAVLAMTLVLAPAALSLLVWRAIGGHLGLVETLGVALGALLHVAVLAAWGCAAAAWTRSFAAAIVVTLAVSVGSWILDGASEFAALSWLAPVARLSLSPHLEGLQRGLLRVADVGWLLLVVTATLSLAYVGLRVDARPRRRALAVVATLLGTVPLLLAADRHEEGWDLSESRRASLPQPTSDALRALDAPVTLDVWLDRDDARRTHVERDALTRLRLVLDSLTIRFPLDEVEEPTVAIRDEEYGLIVVTVGDVARSTRSTARRELSTLILEVAGRPVPPWSEHKYHGHALVIDSATRAWIVVLEYLLIPLALAAIGTWLWLRS